MKKYIPLIFLLLALNAYCQNPPPQMPGTDQPGKHQRHKAKGKTKTQALSPEIAMQQADSYFNVKKYAKAYPLYQQIVFERNSSIASDAQMKLAQCFFYLNKFSDAVVEYDQLIKLFPDYPNINQAYYQIGVCYLELSPKPQYSQEDTQKAIDAFQMFIDKFPNDKLRPSAVDDLQKAQYKLLEKEYNNGYIYYKMADYSASLLYFNEITALANQDRLERMSLYYSAKIYIAQKNWLLANQTFETLQKDFPKSKETRKIKDKLQHKKHLN
jgi:outer membrane protein assembly factor BamD